MENKEQIIYLLEQYMSGRATTGEQEQLFSALYAMEDASEWSNILQDMAANQPPDPGYDPGRWEPVVEKILQKFNSGATIEQKKPTRKLLTLPRVAAAVAILLAVGGILFIAPRSRTRKIASSTQTVPQRPDILPGGNKAMLTLSDGSVIALDSARNGVLAHQGGSRILKEGNDMLAYNHHNSHEKAVYNTVTTPPGGQFQLVLSDGTKVWLNAASSLKFPTVFTDRERSVTLTGEAYFEVVHHADHPFRVIAGSVLVEDLGTHFDIKAYEDETVLKATLLEGSVKVSREGKTTTLSPGQQAQVAPGIGIKRLNVDVDEAIAWKNGFFDFTDADVASIMQQIARWYDVEIVYQAGIPGGHITGKIPRHTDLSNVLQMMELSGIHFKIEGRKLIVYPQ